ncbi:transcriptional regulator [Pseudoalteromonas porphyrae]|uniref:RodZ domain-containing protein n=1 Tax=Pseudoalteromonas neustonica TaxID=1840331 RepID=A0ABU9TY34_9GAMM|nr:MULTISPECIES: RodZ domain-containing protein [Pseudoalteromonas]KPH95697.1 transcriptional regulator [Pseudoalteromonas porphyrae]NNG41769.1 helix-turn-helix domain-containing protein [Pseudoalteromonas sp. NEC-BIFX-2020_002]
MNDENTESTPITLGQTLKNAREQANVSREELANKLKLSVLQLQHLENDDHLLLGPATFTKGYAKSYCREFNLDKTAVMNLFPEQPEVLKKSNMQSFSKRTEKEANDSRLMLVSYAILAIVIGSSALWWWQNATPIKESVVTPLLNNTLGSDEENQVPKNTTELKERDITNADFTADDANDDSVLPDDEKRTKIEQMRLSASQVSFPSSKATQTATADKENALSTIVMRFNQESWVEIHDGEGDKVAFGVKKAGYVMTVSGKPPFSVVLGKHQVIDITLDGDAIDISHFPQNRLAKFNLPLAE